LKKIFSKKNILYFLFLGVLIGLAYVSRPEYFFLIFPVIFYFFVIYNKKIAAKKIIILLLSMIFGFLIVSGPYFIFLRNNLGHWTISGRFNEIQHHVSGEELASIQQNKQSDKLNTSVITPPKVKNNFLKTVVINFRTFTERFIENLLGIHTQLMVVFGFIGILFFSFGIREFIVTKKFKDLALVAIVLLPIFILALAMVDAGKPNYLIQFMYIITLVIAFGIVSFYNEMLNYFSKNKKFVKIIFCFLLLLMMGYLFFPAFRNYFFSDKDYQPKEFKLIGQWIKENVPNIENETILARKPDIAFYSESLWQIVPTGGDLQDLIFVMKNNNIKYISVDDRYFKTARPEFSDLLEPQKVAKDFILIKEVSLKGNRVFLYELK
ncbi:hypothetical protein KAH94_06605, partial [bacterium]|nr:hypothetical protein [bacterium]